MLSAFRVRKYRCFADWTDIELRPLTLLFGYNNAGKSAIVRFLPGLSESLRAEGDPFHLEGQAFRGATFTDLAWKASPETEFELRWDDGARARWLLRYDPSTASHWVDEHEIAPPEAYPLDLRWTGRSRDGSTDDYLLDGEPSGSCSFRSLVLQDDDERAIKLALLLKEFARDVAWIEGYRQMPERSSRMPSSETRDTIVDGRAAAGMLARQARINGGALLDEVGAFYEAIGYQLAILPKPENRFGLTLARKNGWPVNLVDTGEGMAQVLPVLVALERARLGLGPRLVCIEQPELHLHPAAERALAERLVKAAMQDDPAVMLVETHANHLMLAVQLALAKGDLAPERVGVYWVRQLEDGRSLAEPVELDRLGRDTSDIWPPGVFTEDAQLAREILRARRERGDS